MPISSKDFQKGKVVEGSSKLALNFLLAHKEQAFTQDEIISGLNPNPTKESFIHFLSAMAPLQLQGLVERRQMSDDESDLYYKAT